MKLTQKLLNNYLMIERTLKSLEKRKNKIRELILKYKQKEFTLGSFEVGIIEFTRFIPAHKQNVQRIKVKRKDKI